MNPNWVQKAQKSAYILNEQPLTAIAYIKTFVGRLNLLWSRLDYSNWLKFLRYYVNCLLIMKNETKAAYQLATLYHPCKGSQQSPNIQNFQFLQSQQCSVHLLLCQSQAQQHVVSFLPSVQVQWSILGYFQNNKRFFSNCHVHVQALMIIMIFFSLKKDWRCLQSLSASKGAQFVKQC